MVISNEELGLIEQIRANIADLQLTKIDADDRTLVRFLRARNHSVTDAEYMFRRQIEWRQEHDMDGELGWEYPPEYKSKYWPWYLPSFDKFGGPFVIFHIGVWDGWTASEKYDDAMRYCRNCFENGWRMMLSRAADEPEHPQFTGVIDVKGLCLRTISNPTGMQALLEVFKNLEANYPETVRALYIINAPYVFNIAWRMVKPILSERTLSKIQIVSDMKILKKELLNLVDEDKIPVSYGGTLPDNVEVLLRKGRGYLDGQDVTEIVTAN